MIGECSVRLCEGGIFECMRDQLEKENTDLKAQLADEKAIYSTNYKILKEEIQHTRDWAYDSGKKLAECQAEAAAMRREIKQVQLYYGGDSNGIHQKLYETLSSSAGRELLEELEALRAIMPVVEKFYYSRDVKAETILYGYFDRTRK